MTEIILNLAALLLALFCLVYGLRRRPGALPRRGLSALRGDAHALLTAMACWRSARRRPSRRASRWPSGRGRGCCPG